MNLALEVFVVLLHLITCASHINVLPHSPASGPGHRIASLSLCRTIMAARLT